MPFHLPTTAADFVSLMESIWDGPLHPLHYDEWENALRVARLSAKSLYPGRSRNGECGQLFLFPDGSRAWVRTGACQVVRSRPPVG